MRRVLAILAAAVLTAATLSGQSNTPPQGGEAGTMVSVSNGQHFILPTTQTEFYLGQPVLHVPAIAVPGETLRAVGFSLRSWKEGDGTRVVVYAVVSDARTPSKELETVIATYALKQGASARVAETADWGAEPMIIRNVRSMR
jgi:hypothetical protein